MGTIMPIIKIQAIARKKYVLSNAFHDSRYAQEHQKPDLDTKARSQAAMDKPTRAREINYPNFLPGAQIIMRMSATAGLVLECEIYLLSLSSVS